MARGWQFNDAPNRLPNSAVGGGNRSGALFRCTPGSLSEQTENHHPLGLAFQAGHPDGLQLEPVTQTFGGTIGQQNLALGVRGTPGRLLSETLQPGRRVDHVADGRVFDALRAAQTAGDDRPGGNADADPDPR